MTLNTVATLPPSGWIYSQPETNWNYRSMGTFKEAVKNIVEHRRANSLPRATMDEAALDLQDFTCNRLGNDPRFCVQKKTIPTEQLTFPLRAQHAAEAVVSGAAILKDWLGQGGEPVESHLAESRARTCETCPENKPANFFQKITGAVAEAIKIQRAQKANLDLRVASEDKLNTCAVCECHLPLKVWVPMAVISERTKPETMEKFPAWCWMKTETRRKNESISITTQQPETEKE